MDVDSDDDIVIKYLDKYDYVIDEKSNIKLYNGVLNDKKAELINKINYYKSALKEPLFTELESSTLTSKGFIKNIDFKDESIIDKMKLPTDMRIIKIGSNQAEIYNFPNEYVFYNLGILIDILKNSLNTAFKTRIECNCKNLIDHREYILKKYEIIKENIHIIKQSEIIKKIEKYLLTKKNRNKVLLDRLIKIIKKTINCIFLLDLYEELNMIGITELFVQIEKNPLFERDVLIQSCKTLFHHIFELIRFFKLYIETCTCVNQPYIISNKIEVKTITEDIKNNKNKKVIKKKYTRRKSNGSGKYFNSQITFEVFNIDMAKIYKIKIFRTGKFQAPGIRNKDMGDLIVPLMIVSDYLIKYFETQVEIEYMISVMRNYSCGIINKEVNTQFTTHIYLDKLEKICRIEKKYQYIPIDIIIELQNKSNIEISQRILSFLEYTSMDYSEIINNIERYPGLLLKFARPTLEKPNKKLTVKILCNGKIYFDGCNSELDAYEMYYWLQNLFIKYKLDIMFDLSKIVNMDYISPDSEEGYQSIYED